MHTQWLGFIILNILDVCWCCGSDPPPPNKPPTITCPSVATTWTVGRGKTTAVVTWGSPSTSDPEKKPVAVALKTGKGSGAIFGRGHHSVIYTATDDKGLKDFCSFDFIVKVPECRPLSYLSHGRIQCDGYTYGKSCSFSCEEGYRLVGTKSVSCEVRGKWSGGTPQCVAKECPVLQLPTAGLSYRCTNARKFNSICWLSCDEKKGYAPVRGQWTKCTKDQTWTTLDLICEDVEPPVFDNCPAETILRTKDPKSSTTEIKWPTITASDNSKKRITVRSSHPSATPSGGVFEEGTDLVQFTAVDEAGNRAESCYFLIKVRAVTCDPPTFDDEYLDTPGCLDFKEGSSCKLKCFLAIKLVAKNKYITCRKEEKGINGFWDYGQYDKPPSAKPMCNVHTCPALNPPKNGALACDEWTKGEQCVLFCNKDYDIPESVAFTSNLFLCGKESGKWNGKPDIQVPNCEFREYGSQYRMNAYYYFTGSCQDAKQEIKTEFIATINEKNACPEKEYCTIQYVKVICGDEDDDEDSNDKEFDFRRKRSVLRSHRKSSRGRTRGTRRRRPQLKKTSFITFRVVVGSVKKAGSFVDIKAEYTRKLKTYASSIGKLSFVVKNRRINAKKLRIRDALPICEPGRKIGFFNKDSCVPCYHGSYHNISRDECVACALGKYQDKLGSISCKPCPHGQTTVTLGNLDTKACQVMCRPGEYSKKGVVPCVKCPRGRYQPDFNSRTCKQCPVGMTTEDDGASSESLCIPYDILLQGPVHVTVEGRLPAQICQFTFSIWVKVVDTNYGGIHFKVYSPLTKVGIEIVLSGDIRVTIGTQTTTVSDAIKRKWVHVAVTWSQPTLKVYTDGNLLTSRLLQDGSQCPLPSASVMEVHIRDQAYMYIRDMNLLRTIDVGAVGAMATTCSTYNRNSLFNLVQLDIYSLDRVNEVIPSTCLRKDICATFPCGENVCIPRRDTFECVCKGGYSGEKCDIPPDFCKTNICKNDATCIVTGSDYKCSCKPGFIGLLCEQKIADGGWSVWQSWGECSVSCGKGTKIKHRFCTNPPPDKEGLPCRGPRQQVASCEREECPECDLSTLIVGKGIIKTCEKTDQSIKCSVKCEIGKVFPDPPVDYHCNLGIWTPSRQTVSCTDPVSPIHAGINYTVVFGESVLSHGDVNSKLEMVGASFSCAQSRSCNIQVGSSACTDHVTTCSDHGGEYYGSLVVTRDVPEGNIDVTKIQRNAPVMKYLSPLFATWNVFTHTSNEPITFEHRALELTIDRENKLQVYPYDQPALSVEVPGQFGNIMKTWKHLDDTNWEVRTNNYTNFDMTKGHRLTRKPLFLSAVQVMTCPTGAVQGGVFCIKCPPGKMYMDKGCVLCRHGYYQHQPGMSACVACPGFKTTELLGTPDVRQCLATKASQKNLVMGLSNSRIGILHLGNMFMDTITLDTSMGGVDVVSFNPRDGFVYFSTQDPTSIGRVRSNGSDKKILAEINGPDMIITGLDIDVGSGLVIYTTNSGILGALHVTSGAHHILMTNLTKPRDLVLDQKYGIYWVESNHIKHLKYDSKQAVTILTDKYAVWNPSIDAANARIMWMSFDRLRSADLDGTKQQTLANGFTSRFGFTDEYYFYLDANNRLVRVNKDLSAKDNVHSVSTTVNRMKVVSTVEHATVSNKCDAKVSVCDHGCFPSNTISWQCFCSRDHTLQMDTKTCRRDFSVELETSDPTNWEKPSSRDYRVPPSMTLRFKVKACHSARIALVDEGKRLYRVELGQKRGNVTELALRKQWPNRPKVLLDNNEANLLDCSRFQPFWITWKNKLLKVGFGERVGEKPLLIAADARPFDVNYIMFSTGFNATATWHF